MSEGGTSEGCGGWLFLGGGYQIWVWRVVCGDQGRGEQELWAFVRRWSVAFHECVVGWRRVGLCIALVVVLWPYGLVISLQVFCLLFPWRGECGGWVPSPSIYSKAIEK